MSLKERAEKLKTDIPALFLALKHKRTPLPAKIIAAITVAYALSPVDLIPEDVLTECREQAKELWQDGKPRKWFYALPIVFVWLLLIFVIVKAVFF